MAAGSGGSSASRQPPYDQDDYDEDSNLINIHGVATFNCASGEGRTCSPLILHSPVSNVRDFLGDLMMFLQ